MYFLALFFWLNLWLLSVKCQTLLIGGCGLFSPLTWQKRTLWVVNFLTVHFQNSGRSCLHLIKQIHFGKACIQLFSHPAIGKQIYVEHNGLFSFGTTTSLREGKLWIQARSTPLKNWPYVTTWLGEYLNFPLQTISLWICVGSFLLLPFSCGFCQWNDKELHFNFFKLCFY